MILFVDVNMMFTDDVFFFMSVLMMIIITILTSVSVAVCADLCVWMASWLVAALRICSVLCGKHLNDPDNLMSFHNHNHTSLTI